MGIFIIENPRLGIRRVTRGLITRNFAKILQGLLQPRQTWGSGAKYAITLRDVNGNDKEIWTIGNLYDNMSDRYVTFFEQSVRIFTSVAQEIELGLFFKVGKGSLTLSPDNYELADPVQEVPASEASRVDNPDNTILSITGSGTANTSFNCTEVGAYLRLLRGSITNTREVFDALIDHAQVTGISYSPGDTISIQYKLTLA